MANTPIVRLLSEAVPHLIAWCTPSILFDAPRVTDIYRSDMSVSYNRDGDPTEAPWDERSGVFGEACRLAACAYHADVPESAGHCLFSVNGSSGANFVVIKALQRQFAGRLHILTERNIHKSVAEACEDYRVRLSFLKPAYHPNHQFFVPGTSEAYVERLKADPSINLILLTSPTYEGFSIDMKGLVNELRAVREDLIVFVDEAWGSNFQFSPVQPMTAMDSGADISVMSTHKQGGALQQTAIILWKDRRIDRSVMFQAYRSLLTTSPSWHLLASIDGCRAYLEEHGAEAVQREIEIAEYLERELRDVLVRLTVDDVIKVVRTDVTRMDQTKLLFHLQRAGLSAKRLAVEMLQTHQVVVEKTTEDLMLLVVPFQNTMVHARKTARAIWTSIEKLERSLESAQREMPHMPEQIEKVKETYEVGLVEPVTLSNGAAGRISAENVVPYPPGIPLIMKGERIMKEHVRYIDALKRAGENIIMRDRNSALVESDLGTEEK